MRTLLIISMLALVTVLSGCADDGAGGGSSDDNVPSVPTNTTALEPLHWEDDVIAGADPFNAVPVVGGTPCSTQASSCDKHTFTVNETVNLTATLAWGIMANDLDLYLYRGDTAVSQDGINNLGDPPGPPQQVLRADVPAGTYTFWVVMWNAAADHYDLDVALKSLAPANATAA